MAHMEKALSSQRIFEGQIINLRKDTVELEDGSQADREVVEHSGGVGILALDEENRVLMVRQYRYAIGRESLEIPAGKRSPGEEPEMCGRRELEEETGHTAGWFKAFGSLDPTPAYVTEVIYLFLAGDLTPTQQHLDDDEFLTVERIPLEDAVELCISGEITDAKTQIAILKYHALQSRGNGAL